MIYLCLRILLNNMSLFKKHYKSLSQVEKLLYREKFITELDIDYTTFYTWLTRDHIPKHKIDEFNQKINSTETKKK